MHVSSRLCTKCVQMLVEILCNNDVCSRRDFDAYSRRDCIMNACCVSSRDYVVYISTRLLEDIMCICLVEIYGRLLD